MPRDESKPRWSQLFQELKNHFEFVGAYRNPESMDQVNQPFSIMVANEKPTPGAGVPYAVFSFTREMLQTGDVDFDAALRKAIQLAKQVTDAPRAKDKSYQGRIRLDHEVRLEPADRAGG